MSKSTKVVQRRLDQLRMKRSRLSSPSPEHGRAERIQSASVSLYVLDANQGWEYTDRITITVNNGSSDIIVDTAGSDIDEGLINCASLATESWLTLGADLSGANNGTLSIKLEANAAAEFIYLDNVEFRSAAYTPASGSIEPVVGTVSQWSSSTRLTAV